ncbi:hypothetical protein L2449_27430 [Mesorhizobium muleiense]|uniref:hypothetical protein n=1 Tax=Mesorhizobium muleiense TaxID=1004279 RepID=UPI001F1F8250|nr:hypothetical protein [Mesorhizobium muleiense]MCF6120559.1 hypothetical protein [Mesorhizobium muleiense]
MPRLVDVAEKECPADFIEKHWLGPKNQAVRFGVSRNGIHAVQPEARRPHDEEIRGVRVTADCLDGGRDRD